jgi:pimeloyl-ACP methyl ester carboxylesterase
MKRAMKRQYIKLIFISIVLLGLVAAPGARAGRSCESLFQKDRLETAKTRAPKLLVDETLEIQLDRDLASRFSPLEGQTFTKSVPTFEVRHTAKQISRKTVVSGQKYLAIYHRWSPVGIKPKGIVLLQHGFSRSHLYFHDMTLLLLSLGYDVIAADGVNVGGSLIATLAKYKAEVIRPSPLDDAMTWQAIVRHEDVGRFIVVGHSRGHAVTTLFLASGLYDNRLILHVPLNPYVNWLVDQHLDDKHLVMERRSSEASDGHRFESANSAIRATYNQMAVFGMQMGIVKSFSHQEAHERIELPVSVQEHAVTQIGEGLRGENPGRRGFSVLPFYDKGTYSIEASDNGFGFNVPGVSLAPLSRKVLMKTHVIVSADDDITKPETADAIVENLPRQRSQLTVLQPYTAPAETKYKFPTTVPADHYSPSKQAFRVVARIDLLANREIARRGN